MTPPPASPAPPLLLASGPVQRRPPLAPLANALVVSSSSSCSLSFSSTYPSSSTLGGGGGAPSLSSPPPSPPLPPLPPLLAYLGDPATLSLLDPETGGELARLELDPERDELCAAAWQRETSVLVAPEEGGENGKQRRGGRKRREGRLFVATRTRLLLVDAWVAAATATEAEAAEEEGGGEGRRGRARAAASLRVAASQPLHFWPKALAVRSGSAVAPPPGGPSPPSQLPAAAAAAAVEVAVAGGPGVVLFSLSRSRAGPPASAPAPAPAPSAAAAAEEEEGAAATSPPFSFSRLRTLCSPWPACAVCYSRGGDEMAAAGPAGQLWIWAGGGGGARPPPSPSPPAPAASPLLPPLCAPALHAQVPHERVTALEFSPCGAELAVACWGGAVLLYSRKEKREEGERGRGAGCGGDPPPPLLPAGLCSGPAVLALEATADDGGPPASDWELSGGLRPAAASAALAASASSAPGPRATLLAWRRAGGGQGGASPAPPRPPPLLLAVARAGRSLAVVSVEARGRSREAAVAWEAPAGVVVAGPAGGERGRGGGRAAPARDNGGDGRGPLPEGLPSLPLPARAAGGERALPPAPPLPLPAGVRGLAVCEAEEGGGGGGEGTILWCDGEGRLGRARW